VQLPGRNENAKPQPLPGKMLRQGLRFSGVGRVWP
jgi:hypothetical protein